MNLRVIGNDGTSSTSDIIKRMEFANREGVEVISMNLSGDTRTNDPFFDVVRTVSDKRGGSGGRRGQQRFELRDDQVAGRGPSGDHHRGERRR